MFKIVVIFLTLTDAQSSYYICNHNFHMVRLLVVLVKPVQDHSEF